jgi:hypothetical protein
MATSTRVAGNEEDEGVEEGNETKRATTAKRAMATATWVAGDKEGDGDGSRSGCEGDDVDDDKDNNDDNDDKDNEDRDNSDDHDNNNNGDEDEDEDADDDEEGTVRTFTVFFGRCLMGFFSRRGFSPYS